VADFIIFQPDPTSTSFQKPETAMNIASGCPKFIEHIRVKKEYLFDSGCIYFRVKVDGESKIA
jgi:hypothetical protein